MEAGRSGAAGASEDGRGAHEALASLGERRIVGREAAAAAEHGDLDLGLSGQDRARDLGVERAELAVLFGLGAEDGARQRGEEDTAERAAALLPAVGT